MVGVKLHMHTSYANVLLHSLGVMPSCI